MSLTEIESQIGALTSQLQRVEELLEKDFEEWTQSEKNQFGNHEQLRKKEEQLRKKEEQLREKEEQLRELLILKEKEKQQQQQGNSLGG